MRFTSNQSASLVLIGTLATSQLACSAIVSPDPSRLGLGEDANSVALDASAPDAFVPEGTDANFPDAFTETPDAYVPPGVDAFSPDAFVVVPDAFIPDTGCVAGSDRCMGTTLTRCVDGRVVTSTCMLGCAEAEARCRVMVPSNVEPTLLSEGTMDIVLTSAMLNTSECRRVVTQLGGGRACLLVARNIIIPASSTVRVTGTLPVIILASGTVTIDGVLDLSAEGSTPGPGGYLGAPVTTGNASVRGPQRGNNGMSAGVFLDSGGGGGGHCGSGGAGGGADTVVGGSGGTGIATTLEPLSTGSGGGFGQGGLRRVSSDVTPGGAGGGAIQISSAVSISISGRIDVGGGGGQGGRNNMNWGAGGGGGAGGGILLEAPVLTLEDGAELLATGGGGGAGRDGSSAPAGQDGRRLAGPAAGGIPTGLRSADGGDSGGGAVPDGMDGETNTAGDGNGGGGGGGVGCIVLRALVPSAPGGTLSPSDVGLQSLPLLVR